MAHNDFVIIGSGETDESNFGATICDLDMDSLKLILSIKSDQEEIADFSFSFNQVTSNDTDGDKS